MSKHRIITPPVGTKPRVRTCAYCGRQLYGSAHRLVVIEGQPHTTHVGCAEPMASEP